MSGKGLCIAVFFYVAKGAVIHPNLQVDDEPHLGQPTSLCCICDKPITLREPKGTAVMLCISTDDCLNNRPEYIYFDRSKSGQKTYVVVIKETRAEDEGDWRCQCGSQEDTATLRIQRTTSLDLNTPEPTTAAAYPALNIDGSPTLGQPTSLRCICDKAITLREPKGTAVMQCKSTDDCLNNRPEYIYFDRSKSGQKTYVVVINETRAEDEGDWRCQCGSQEVTVTLRIRGSKMPLLSNSSCGIYPSFRLLIFLLQLICLT